MDASVIRFYRGLHMPHLLWIVELADADETHSIRRARLYGEVLIDPTSEPDNSDFVALHLPRRFMRMGPQETDSAPALKNAFRIPHETVPWGPLFGMK